MFRRQFVSASLKTLSLAFLPPALLAACGKDDDDDVLVTDKSVIVIGAGMAGLAAARRLKAKGFAVTVLESQSKAGGRIRTQRSGNFVFDEGASWIHGPVGNPVTALAAEAGAATVVTDDESLQVFDANGQAYGDAFLDAQYTQYEGAINRIRSAGSSTQSVEQVFASQNAALTTNRLWKYMLSAYLEFDTGGDVAALSSRHFDDDESFAGTDVFCTNGYYKITDYLARNLTIQFNARVTEIDYSGTKPFVVANGIRTEADYIVCTLPLGVLKANVVSIKPALPQPKLAAIQQVGMGNVNKFALLWAQPFWDANTTYIGYTPETKGKFNYFLNLKKATGTVNGLMTFAFGQYAALTETMSDQQITAEIMGHLRQIYGNAIASPQQLLRTRWGQNPHSLGAYSFAGLGSAGADFQALATAVQNKLFFAGEHTEPEYRGTVHGAYLSGMREAEKIIDLQ